MSELKHFETLNKINVSDKTEEKNGLTYLSWVWAWSKVKTQYPNAKYNIKKFGDNQLPYVYDNDTGYMVFTDITIEDITHEMWLPVMDGANKAMLNHGYEYKVKEYVGGKATGHFITKRVNPADMFDVNKTIMRCLVKNIAMFGLGLHIYAGEDYPEGYALTKEEAGQIKLTFGKHKGQTLEEVLADNKSYLTYLLNNEGTNQSLKNACELLLDVKPIKGKTVSNAKAETDVKKSLKLKKEFDKYVVETETDLEQLLKYYKVKDSIDLNFEQLTDAIKIMAQKIEIKEEKSVF